jgi:hypothetical protein
MRERSLALPSYVGPASADEGRELRALVTRIGSLWPWRRIDSDHAREFDLILFRGPTPHIGIAIDKHRMLHALPDGSARVERYDIGRWRMRMEGIYRHTALDGEIVTDGARVVVIDHPFIPARDRREFVAPAGLSIEDIVEIAVPDHAVRSHSFIRVAVGTEIIDRAWWARTRPRPGATVIIRSIPSGDFLRSGLMLLVAFAAIVVAPILAPQLVGALGGAIGLQTATGLIGLGIITAGTLLINALIPQRLPQIERANIEQSSARTINGWRNQIAPRSPIPAVLGRHRVAPPYIVKPYRTIIGDDMYVTAAFVIGYGPVTLDDPRFGNTPVTEFGGDVQMELREGRVGDPPLTLVANTVLESGLQVTLQMFEDHFRTTPRDVTRATIMLVFPQGIGYLNKNQQLVAHTVAINIKQRRSGTNDPWENVPGLTEGGDGTAWYITAARRGTIYRQFTWEFPERGQWDIAVRRVNQEYHKIDFNFVDEAQWFVLQTERPEYPIACPIPLALAAFRARASDRLQGEIDQFNVIAQLLCDDLVDGEWVPDQPTSNVASMLRWMLTGPANAMPVEFTRIDDAAFAELHSRGMTYNRVHDFEGSLQDALADCAAAGRAMLRDTGTEWTVFIDEATDRIDAHISAVNVSDVSWTRKYLTPPDAFRVRFVNADRDYIADEMIVPWPDGPEVPQRLEDIEFPGLVHAEDVWMAARRRQYELIYRLDEITCTLGIDGLMIARGDVVAVNLPAIIKHHAAAQCTSIDGNRITIAADVEIEAGRNYGIRVRHVDDSGERSVVRKITAPAGMRRSFNVIGDASDIAVGDLVMVGEYGFEAMTMRVRDVEGIDNARVRVTLIPMAPEIDARMEDEEPPEFDGRYGDVIDFSTVAPEPPVITRVVSGDEISTAAHDIEVFARPSFLGIIAVTIEIEHRLAGDTGWSGSVSMPAGQGMLGISGYAAGDEVELRARSVSAYGVYSDYSDIVVHEVQEKTVPPPPLDVEYVIVMTNVVRISWTMPDFPNLRIGRVYISNNDAFDPEFEIASRLGIANQRLEIEHTQSPGTSYYRVRVETIAGAVSDPSDYIEVTVT